MSFSLLFLVFYFKIQYIYPVHVTRNIEHHIERHYEIESDKNYILQELEVGDEFYEDRLDHCLKVTESLDFDDVLMDHYGEHEAIDDFGYLKERSFTAFFRDNAIDVPRCFRKTRSVRRPLNQVDLLKFNNYLMRDGKRLKVFKYLTAVLWGIFHDRPNFEEITFKTHLPWQSLFLSFTYITRFNERYVSMPNITEEATTYGHVMVPYGKVVSDDWNFTSFMFKNIYQMFPLFSFYIYKVDKKIFKNTRGKSGKFTFIWKYVAPYKRLFLVMHWLLKELRIRPGRSLRDRLDVTLRTLLTTPQQTWMWRIRKFSHKYVYRNCRHSLAESYRTVTK